ncbi:MAG TPA: histidine ammonia-lyase [Gemmatimonadaceae bacterium]|jgi:histidine ammonia-lyase|nr:histidine ammonia-lyase [Gemmatimonadaceae bacterium]
MLTIDGHSLTLDQVARVADGREHEVRLTDDSRARVAAARDYVDQLVTRNERVYGISTGFGRLAEVFIAPARLDELQLNLVRSHSSGFGPPLCAAEVRTIMLLRANALARGNSGCRLVVIERLLDFIRLRIHPIVPEIGSVGASGDLAPLAHVALALIGEGHVEHDGLIEPSATALRRAGIEPLRLVAKEGLALINGTQATTGLGLLSLLAAERATDSVDVAGAMSLEGLRGTPDPFRPEIHATRAHAGQAVSAARLWALLEQSEIRESHRYNDPRVHDAYSLRCMPQVHGAAREVMGYVRRVIETEINSSTDNPLIFPEQELVVSAGNFHAQIVSQALDFLAIAVADLASISERRVERLLNPDLSELPAFLARDPGVQTGFMIAQVAVADLLSEMRVLSHPASVDSVPTSGSKEDHVSMGMAAARKAKRTVGHLEYVVAVELMCAAQALEFRKPLQPGLGVREAYARVRERVLPLDGDRVLTPDIENLRAAVHDGTFAAIGQPELMPSHAS